MAAAVAVVPCEPGAVSHSEPSRESVCVSVCGGPALHWSGLLFIPQIMEGAGNLHDDFFFTLHILYT